MKQSRIARQRLDDAFRASRAKDLALPHRGWVRAIRESLAMSTTDLGHRMGISQQAVSDLEKGELRATVQLNTLERAAAAMDCELIYAIVPRTSLDDIVNERARTKARELLLTVDHHSRLEDQAVSSAEFQQQIEEIQAELVDQRGLWRDPK